MEFLGNMKKLSKSKKQISTFTRGLGSLIGSISLLPEVVVKLEGNSVIDFDFDIFSHPDPQGRRWINSRGHTKSNFLQEAMNKKVIDLMLEMTGKIDQDFRKYLFDSSKYVSLFNELTGKQKSEVIKLYIDNVTSLMTNTMYANITKEILADPYRKIGTYDEIIMNQFKILGVYSIESGRFKYDQSMAQYQIEKMGFKYLGHISQDDFRNFSTKTF